MTRWRENYILVLAQTQSLYKHNTFYAIFLETFCLNCANKTYFKTGSLFREKRSNSFLISNEWWKISNYEGATRIDRLTDEGSETALHLSEVGWCLLLAALHHEWFYPILVYQWVIKNNAICWVLQAGWVCYIFTMSVMINFFLSPMLS